MFSSKEEMRGYAAEMFGLVVATSDNKRHTEVIKELTNNLQNQVIFEALAFVVAYPLC